MIDNTQLISVVMLVHNAGEYLSEAVESILTQINVNLELILVDDHSTDDAINNLPKNFTQDIRFKKVLSQQRGVVAAMAMGFSEAQRS